MAGIKDIKNEISELRNSVDRLTDELQKINITIKESLQITSQTIRDMSEALEANMRKMSDLTNVRDTILKNLGIDGIIPGFLKRKK